MRLIDADDLLKFENEAWGDFGDVSPTAVYNIILDDIREAKTVEAIPIDWIADWLAYNQRRIDDGENADDSVEWMLRAWFIEKSIERERKKRNETD